MLELDRVTRRGGRVVATASTDAEGGACARAAAAAYQRAFKRHPPPPPRAGVRACATAEWVASALTAAGLVDAAVTQVKTVRVDPTAAGAAAALGVGGGGAGRLATALTGVLQAAMLPGGGGDARARGRPGRVGPRAAARRREGRPCPGLPAAGGGGPPGRVAAATAVAVAVASAVASAAAAAVSDAAAAAARANVHSRRRLGAGAAVRSVPLPTAASVRRARGLPVAAPGWQHVVTAGGGGQRPPRSTRCVAPSVSSRLRRRWRGRTVVGSGGDRVAARVREGWTDEEAVVTERPPKMRRRIDSVRQTITPVGRKSPPVLLLTS